MCMRMGLGVVGMLAASVGAQNIVVNGDFENNSAGSTQFNLNNAQFTSMMANATGFGTSDELDIVTGLSFGIAPQSGNWKVGMHQKNLSPDPDAFSLDLSSAVVAGQSYTLEFYCVGLQTFPVVPIGRIDVGLSNSDTSFGTGIFSGVPTGTAAWTKFSVGFVAPVNAAYLTFSTSGAIQNGYVFVDNVSLTPSPAGALVLAGLALGARRRR